MNRFIKFWKEKKRRLSTMNKEQRKYAYKEIAIAIFSIVAFCIAICLMVWWIYINLNIRLRIWKFLQ